METIFSVRDAAARLNVSTSTFKRLCERHAVQLERTPGGHRRITLEALRELEIKFCRPGGQKSRCGIPPADKVLSLLMNQQSWELGKLLLTACKEPSDVAVLCDESLAPAMWQVGTMWQRGEIKVYEEHLCTETLLRTLDFLAPYIRQPRTQGWKAVGGSLGKGVDSVASKMVALSLSSIGVTAIDLGPRIPTEEMAAATIAMNADLVWSTHTHWDDHASTLNSLTMLRELVPSETQIIIGGGGLSRSARRSVPWCMFFERLGEMTTYIAEKQRHATC